MASPTPITQHAGTGIGAMGGVGAVPRAVQQANLHAPFGGRYGNPWLADFGMDPLVQRAMQLDQNMVNAARFFQQPFQTITVSNEQELLDLAAQLGLTPAQIQQLLGR